MIESENLLKAWQLDTVTASSPIKGYVQMIHIVELREQAVYL